VVILTGGGKRPPHEDEYFYFRGKEKWRGKIFLDISCIEVNFEKIKHEK